METHNHHHMLYSNGNNKDMSYIPHSNHLQQQQHHHPQYSNIMYKVMQFLLLDF